MPAWRRAIAAGTWGEIPSTLLSSIDPKDNPLLNPNYPAAAPWNLRASGGVNVPSINAMAIAYCGMSFDDTTGTAWHAIGGGHADNGSNESDRICIAVDAPDWDQFRPPSGSLPLISGGLPVGSTPQGNSFLLDDGLESTGVYADGRPRATHSYAKVVYVPGLGNVLAFHGGGFTSATISSKYVWWLNESTREWEYKPTATWYTLANASSPAACFDSNRGCIYLQIAGTAKMLRLDLDAWTYSEAANAISASGESSCIYLPEHDLVFQACSFWSTKFCLKDPANGLVYQPTTTGTAQSVTGTTGQAWVPGLGMVFVIGKALWLLAPTGALRTDPWAWSLLEDTNASLPTDTSAGGPWTKIGYSRRLKGIYRFTNSSSRPWFFATE